MTDLLTTATIAAATSAVVSTAIVGTVSWFLSKRVKEALNPFNGYGEVFPTPPEDPTETDDMEEMMDSFLEDNDD